VSSTDTDETVATYTVAGKTYEIDHLGINYPEQWGEYAVYCDGQQLTTFGIEEMCLAAVRSPELMPTTDDLIKLAVQAVAEDTGDEGPVYPQPGAPIPLELNGGMAGFVVGECGHRVAESEWRAGFRNCERDGG
jgi:hypothetical protein